jgi:hypothetical protein
MPLRYRLVLASLIELRDTNSICWKRSDTFEPPRAPLLTLPSRDRYGTEIKVNGMKRRDTFLFTRKMGIPKRMEWEVLFIGLNIPLYVLL